jgi:hypothetical protein
MFLTPVLYPITFIPKVWLYTLNPMACVVDGAKYCLLGIGEFNYVLWACSLLVTAVILCMCTALQLTVCKGEFSTITDHLKADAYSLVHIDTDLYQPTCDCFDYFAPKLQQGGVIIIDDYQSKKCPGVATAVHKFLDETPGFALWSFQTEQALLTKIT